MMKSSKIILGSVFCLMSICNGYSQNQLDKKLKGFAEFSLSSKWAFNVSKDNTVEYAFTDSIDLCKTQDLSPIRNYCLDTLNLKTFKLEVLFEKGWSKRRIKRTRIQNEVKTEKIKKRIMAYGDSLNWEMYKVSKNSIEAYPLDYLYLIKDWSSEELDLINSIENPPFDLYKGYGVFINRNAFYITPQRKQLEIEGLYLELENIGLKSFKIFTVKREATEYEIDY